MKRAIALHLLVVLVILAGCGGQRTTTDSIVPIDTSVPTDTPAPTDTPEPTSILALPDTPEPEPQSEPKIDMQSLTAGDWAKMDQSQREQVAEYWLNFWKEAGNETSLSVAEMNVCITEEVVKPDTPAPMLISAISGRCVQQ